MTPTCRRPSRFQRPGRTLVDNATLDAGLCRDGWKWLRQCQAYLLRVRFLWGNSVFQPGNVSVVWHDRHDDSIRGVLFAPFGANLDVEPTAR
jgi:hypothetical protein